MKQVIYSLAFVVLSINAYAQDFYKGLECFEKKDFQCAQEIWTPLAREGDISAMIQLSEMYLKGNGLVRDQAKGIDLMVRAAEAGEPYAIEFLYEGYYSGESGIDKNIDKSIYWLKVYEKAVSGIEKAHHDVFEMHGMMVSYAETIQSRIVAMYEELGRYELAFKWSMEAAKTGDGNAQAKVGGMYLNGTGVKADKKEAVSWLRKASKQGHAASSKLIEELCTTESDSCMF